MDENINLRDGTKEESLHEAGMVHIVLSHSYSVFLTAVILGLILNTIIPLNIFERKTIYEYVGFIMIILGSLLIYWSQSTSSSTKKKMEVSGAKRRFDSGPYKYSRSPTHVGLTIMTLGLALLLNSLFSIILVIIASIITKLVFLKKEEKLLKDKYGQDYMDYMKTVSSWL